ncbi:T9SS type A sorting domain-containing protein [candidate division KSB1 bacterium]|nr:T9SS type A sorting domain-containing protein [candidate division KSB1 bacterium]
MTSSVFAQQSDYIYWRNFVNHSNGQACSFTTPAATFTVFLNHNQERILIENAPRWETATESNIDGKGTFGVELGNFSDPAIAIGDTVSVRFTCKDTGEQGELSEILTDIPWLRFPQTLRLSPLALPSVPANIDVTTDESNYRVIRWTVGDGQTCSIYRRSLQDTLANGRARMLYRRIAENIADSSFIDSTDSDASFAYILYAKSQTGVMSSHSREVHENDRILDLNCTPRTTTAFLKWRAFDSPIGTTKGYTVYRRTENSPISEIIGYAGPETWIIDSRLTPNTIYHYLVKARIDHQTEVGESEEITVRTTSETNLHAYANLKTAVVIYQNTNLGGISDAELPKIKTMLDAGKAFYWRNSGLKLNIQFSYFEIKKHTDFGDPGNTNVGQTVNDLTELGVMNTQYDIIFRITPAVHGYWSYGVINLNLPGPSRETGFSQSFWPPGTGVKFPGKESGVDYNLTWLFVHEAQHAIDALYNANRHPEMYHGDLPWEFPVACGEHFDFQAKMFRAFTAYLDLLPNWGDIYETADNDHDGVPDDDSLVAFDERRLGSSPDMTDTDSDGLGDRQEAINGIYGGSSPIQADSDSDGLPDGADEYPTYPANTHVERSTPVIDGFIESEWQPVADTVSFSPLAFAPNLYLAYDDDFLYLAARLNQPAVPEFYFDFDADGWWHSAGNTVIKPNPASGYFTIFHSWDGSEAVKSWSLSKGGAGGMWDDDAQYTQKYHRRVIDPQTTRMKVNYELPTIQIEIAIPKNEYAGLTLLPGDQFGLNVIYTKLENKTSLWATAFDLYDFAAFTLAGQSKIASEAPASVQIEQFELMQNYPNPFNLETIIWYKVPTPGIIRIGIYNVLGQLVRTLLDEPVQTGIHSITWDGRNDCGLIVPGGIYFCKLATGDGVRLVKKMLVIK